MFKRKIMRLLSICLTVALCFITLGMGKLQILEDTQIQAKIFPQDKIDSELSKAMLGNFHKTIDNS